MYFPNLPLWLIGIILIIFVYAVWKLLKFAIKIFIALIISLIFVIILDYFHVFTIIKKILFGF